MYDILFINPPNHGREDFIPLGLRNLYTIIRDAGYKTGFIDIQKLFITGELEFNHDSMENIYNIIGSAEAKIYAFTLWNTSFPWVISTCKYLKQSDSRSITIIGGPLSTLSSEQILKDYDCIDIACRFEGELIIEPLVNTLLSSVLADIGNIQNISYRDIDGVIKSTDSAPLIDNLDILPMIDITPTDFRSPVINLEAGRGCSFHCYYCSSCFIWKFKPRYKSGKRLFSEIEHICSQYKREGINQPVFHLEHDNFLMKPEVLTELDSRVQETGLKFKYGFAGRADLITDKNLELLKSTGCFYVYLGIETGSARMQKIINKNLPLKKIFSSILKLQKNRIMVNANLMYGFPEENLDDLHASLDLMNTLRYLGVNVYISMLSPESKTPVGDAAPLSDYLFNDSSRYYKELIHSGFKPEEYKKVYLNHLYTLENRHYDILIYNQFVQFWHTLITDYPLTVYTLNSHNDCDWKNIFSVWNNNLKNWNFSGASNQSLIDSFRLFNQNFGQNEKETEIAVLEHSINMRSKNSNNDNDISREQLMEYYGYYNKIRKETIDRLNAMHGFY
ncbi:B12-binding domain-containing radical SAM protein [Desulforegula conservatrix]|uniref:B12-binding domain-containing radical SAM protein n=1 Tax=Desulforegula conservatrix TaxID=153026 RepID=UPI0004104665|nr:radical SAM protein [Desulforegula conservatrix]